ncbi:MAG: AmmeMemoRadiSam system protein A [Chloroflexi bacterium]|nr:AmmeMemoRadiSam system protein A [Chloroflexota bacterium]MBI3167852.1 AmmeMemoRadiSam system protein A [Chloroflexota bacterium]
MSTSLTDGEKQTLLRIAREAIENTVQGRRLPPLEKESLTPVLRENGASFVTLTIHNDLRGCIGALEAHQPLADDVREHAIAAALEDPRFPPVSENELNRIQIEVSYLSQPQELQYLDADDLLKKLRPHIDGVILKHGFRRATFLPQVWEKIPEPEEFLRQLCYKMNERPNLWRETKLQVYVYQVEEFHELN